MRAGSTTIRHRHPASGATPEDHEKAYRPPKADEP